MRAKTFLPEQQLDELAMGPASLRRMATAINAKVGMEFEMYVPNVNSGSDGELEADYDMDERAFDIDDIIRFFDDGDYNSRRAIDKFREEIYNYYYDWCDEERQREWASIRREVVSDYIVNNDLWDEDEEITLALESMNLSDDEKNRAEKVGVQSNARKYNRIPGEVTYDSDDEANWKEAQRIANEKLEEMVDEELSSEGRVYNDAYEEWGEDQDFDQRDFLRHYSVTTMQDAENEFGNNNITWPHWTSSGGGGNRDIDDVASEFEKMIGKPVRSSSDYHGIRNDRTSSYVVEPDSSLSEPNDSSDGGIEFVSPPMSVTEMLNDLKKVKAWADSEGCYTNSSTGLHINVSIDGMDSDSVDYVKLALLMGDKYVLEQFGRNANTYCKSGMDKIKQNALKQPDLVPEMMDKMRAGLNKMASKAIHSGSTDKYTSINNKGNYIEFRSPGDDWLDQYYSIIEPTVLRLVVALDAAINPQKSRQDYLKKLYKLLEPSSKGDDSIQYFAKYSAGEIPKAALRSFIKQIQLKRNNKQNNQWLVTFYDYTTLTVSANTKQEAYDIASEQGRGPIDTVVQKMAPVGPMQDWQVTDTVHGYQQIVQATSESEAIAKAKVVMGGSSVSYPTSQFTAVPYLGSASHRNATQSAAQPGQWARWYIRFEDGSYTAVSARNHSEAMGVASMMPNRGPVYSVTLDTGTPPTGRPTSSPEPAAQPPAREQVLWTIYNKDTTEALFTPFMALPPGSSGDGSAGRIAVGMLNDLGIPPQNRSHLGIRVVEQ